MVGLYSYNELTRSQGASSFALKLRQSIKLHWLPVKFRIQFKLLLLVYKALNGMAPSYLTDKLLYKPVPKLKSSNQRLLVIPRSNLKTYGDRCFSIAGPKLWNSLPKGQRMCDSLELFKKNLKKTHLFKSAFPTSVIQCSDV